MFENNGTILASLQQLAAAVIITLVAGIIWLFKKHKNTKRYGNHDKLTKLRNANRRLNANRRKTPK